MAFTDPDTGVVYLSNADFLRSQREAANNARAADIESKQGQSTGKDSPERVPTLGKRTSRSFMGGGATVYASEVNPTDFIPDPNSDPAKQIPDYYRNGRLVEATKLIDGELIPVREYQPVPELIAERSTPVLASIKLVDPKKIKNNGPTSAVNESSLLIPSYSKFFLEGVREAHQEKFQTVETFNDFYVYFYGERPPIYQFNGHLLNLLNYNWKNEFMYFYQNFWRGTKCAELGARIFLTYDYQQIQGYILNIGTDVNALTDKAAPFNFSMIVTKRLIFNGTADDGIVRDNLLPRSNTGLINTEASSFSKALTSEYLNGQRAAASAKLADAENATFGQRVLANSSSSARKQNIPSAGASNPRSSQSAGGQRANALRKNIGLPGAVTDGGILA